MLQQDAVAAEQLAGVADGFPHPHRAEGLGQRRMLVGGPALGLQLGQPGAQAGRGGDVREHPHQQILDELEAADRPPELLALLGVGEGMLVRAAGAADRLPRHARPGQPQHLRGLPERGRPLQPVVLRHPDPIQRDVGVLHHPQRDLVLDLGGGQARRALLHHEALHLAIIGVARPDDDVVGEGGVPDPFLLPVEDPGVAVAAGGGGHAARHAGPDVRLGQPERADLLHPGHLRQPALLLLLRPAQVYRAHRQAAVHPAERGHRRVGPGQLHREHPVQQRAAAGAAVAGIGRAGDPEPGEGRDQLVRELLPGPVPVDDRPDLLGHELPGALHGVAAGIVEQLLQVVEVGIGGVRHRVLLGKADG